MKYFVLKFATSCKGGIKIVHSIINLIIAAIISRISFSLDCVAIDCYKASTFLSKSNTLSAFNSTSLIELMSSANRCKKRNICYRQV